MDEEELYKWDHTPQRPVRALEIPILGLSEEYLDINDVCFTPLALFFCSLAIFNYNPRPVLILAP